MLCFRKCPKNVKTLFILYILISLYLLLFTKVKIARDKQDTHKQEKVNDTENSNVKHFVMKNNVKNTQNKTKNHGQTIQRVFPVEQPMKFEYWRDKSSVVCFSKNTGSSFTIYDNLFAHMTMVKLDPERFVGSKGGEDFKKVMNQEESTEYLQFRTGCFDLDCSQKSNVYYFTEELHLAKYYNNTVFKAEKLQSEHNDKHPPQKNIIKNRQFTIAVTRYEYVNLYHTMTDWYNAYLMMRFFNKTETETDILFIDSHPSGSLDLTWKTLFNSYTRVRHLSSNKDKIVLYSEMVWNILGYHSPMYTTSTEKSLPLSEEFRTFFLNRHGIRDQYQLNCESIKILFIWRKDYIAHPRNPTGLVARKIANGEDIIAHFQTKYPNYNVTGVQLDAMSMADQLQIVSQTDILVGMHGAGLTMSMFIPKHGCLIELYPEYSSKSNIHFRQIASWRGLHYQSWQNFDYRNELPDKYTVIPVSVLDNLMNKSVTLHLNCS